MTGVVEISRTHNPFTRDGIRIDENAVPHYVDLPESLLALLRSKVEAAPEAEAAVEADSERLTYRQLWDRAARRRRIAGARDDRVAVRYRAGTDWVLAFWGTLMAGGLAVAIDEHSLTPDVERILRAVRQTHVETGTPITVHTSAALKTGLIAQRILKEEGVDLTKVVIGHCGDTTDLDYLREIADAGSLLGMDRFGIDVFLPFEDRVTTVAALAKAGYADRMVLAHDASCYSDF
jgi:hypothetical protein